MGGHGLTRPYGADFCCRIIAYGEHKIEMRGVNAGKFIPGF
jgi:hypothetical protein